LYDVTRATNLAVGAGAFLSSATNLAGTSPENIWTDSVNRATAPAYYRIKVHQ
jgi:hypothetical protein